MYPRLKRVRRGDQVHEYVQLVEGRREAGKVRQRVVATLGRLDELKASGQLDRWSGAFTRLDPPAAGVHREVGPLLVVAHYLRRLGLVGLVDAAAPMRGRAQATHGEVIAALVANRLSGPAPLYDVAGWAGAYAVAELLGVPAGLLNDDRLGRALDALAPVVEDVRARTLLATLERFEVEASRLHLDLTAVRFAGAYLDSALVAKGWAAGFDVDLPGGIDALPELDHVAQREQHLPSQLRTRYRGQLVDYPAVDPKTKSRHAFRVAYTWSSEEARSVADARERALAKAEAALAKVRNGLGGRYYKTVADVEKRVARVVGPKIEPLLVVTVGKTRASKSKPSKPTLAWRRNPAAIAAAARLDGLYALATNLPDRPDRPLTAQDVLDTYKDQWIAEQRNRDAKRPTQLRVRPIFLHTDQRIQALFGVIGIALLIFGLIEADLCRALPADDPRLPGLLPEGRTAKPTARNILVAFEHLALTHTANGPVLDRLTPTQRQILALLDIPLPWPERPEQ